MSKPEGTEPRIDAWKAVTNATDHLPTGTLPPISDPPSPAETATPASTEQSRVIAQGLGKGHLKDTDAPFENETWNSYSKRMHNRGLDDETIEANWQAAHQEESK